MLNICYPRRELIPKGQSGGLVIFDDRPNYWDAWGTFLIPCWDSSLTI